MPAVTLSSSMASPAIAVTTYPCKRSILLDLSVYIAAVAARFTAWRKFVRRLPSLENHFNFFTYKKAQFLQQQQKYVPR